MITEILQTFPPAKIVEVLEEFLTKERILGINRALSKRIHGVQVGIEAPYDVHNGLAIIRTAEALGLGHIHFINAVMKKGQGKNTTKGTLKWVHLQRHTSLDNFLEKTKGMIFAGACPLGENLLEDLPVDRPLCFLFGNEKEGLSKEARGKCDILFKIPMYGMVESLNLSVATAITLYDYLKRKRGALGRGGDLSDKEFLEEKAHFYVRSLGIEQSNEILKRRLL
ncbi:MAG: RNA methyltransferase [Chlamydiia bacterium]|nr:RNA methyltransferase [Chlamydiia bacterium]